MARPTLVNGNIWDPNLANASGNPILDGSDEFGHGAKVIDDWLDDGADQIKANFYGFYDRIQLSTGTGTTLNYTGAPVRLRNGSVVALNAGSVNIPDGTSQFVFVTQVGNNAEVSVSTVLPAECIPLGFAAASSGVITQLDDLRHQRVEEIKPVYLPPQASSFQTGDFKPSLRSTTEAGWLRCDGSTVSKTTYPALFNIIGYQFGGSGDNFVLPDLRARTVIGAGQAPGVINNYPLGATGGEDVVTLNLSQIPSHSHGINQTSHTHRVNDPVHNHTVSETPHTHPLNDPGHRHAYIDRFLGSEIDNSDDVPVSREPNGTRLTDISKTGITLEAATANVRVAGSRSGVTIDSANANISVIANGGGGAHNNMMPFIALHWLVKT
ncbi:tail fiber protein [Oculatella sp. FACHB-28]|uniref:phage tail protein n=1 Tax=Oculatella sp. FACHB-28 TaxID=2692845 RepID=UPI001687FB7C|nr:tail fiber protein [Oculatella sp. FACHB-28]MBD2060524.1 tail fiber protein [Oculatella sp. FACHB-28]